MAPNSLFPGFIKLHHETAWGEHVYTLPVKPYFSVGQTWFLEQKGSTVGDLWTTKLTEYLNVAKTLLHSSQTFTFAELWTMDSPDAVPIFRDSTQTAVVGTHTSSAVQTSQMTYSYRTTGGGSGKVVLLDTSIPFNYKTRPPYGAPHSNITNYLVSASCMICGRDGSYAISVPKIMSKSNDVLRRKYGLA